MFYEFEMADDEAKNALLDEMLGVKGAAARLRRGVRAIKRQLDAQGLSHKSLRRKGLVEDVREMGERIKDRLSDDPDVAAQILQFIMSLMDADQGEMEMEDEFELEEEFELEDEMEDEFEMEDELEDEYELEDELEDEYGLPPQQYVNAAITKRPGTFVQPSPLARKAIKALALARDGYDGFWDANVAPGTPQYQQAVKALGSSRYVDQRGWSHYADNPAFDSRAPGPLAPGMGTTPYGRLPMGATVGASNKPNRPVQIDVKESEYWGAPVAKRPKGRR